MLDNATNNPHSPLAAEEEPLCSILKKNDGPTTHRTSCTSIASLTSRTSASILDSDDPWNFDLDDILGSMSDSSPVNRPSMRAAATTTTTGSPDVSSKVQDSPLPPATLSPLRRPLQRAATTGSSDIGVRKDDDENGAPSFLPSKLSPKAKKSPSRVLRTRSSGSRGLPRLMSLSKEGSCRSLSSSMSSNNSRAPVRRSVSFDKVKVREFQQILGEHPCHTEGPSIGLGWDYYEKKETKVDKFESKRTSVFSTHRRRSIHNISALTPEKREKLARKLGYTEEEIQANVKEAQKVQKQRKKTREEVMIQTIVAAAAVQVNLTNNKNNQEEGYDPLAIMKKAQKAHGHSS